VAETTERVLRLLTLLQSRAVWTGTELAERLGVTPRSIRRDVERLRSLGDEGLERPCGPAEGPFAEESLATLVLHIHRELIHHGAEIALLRDLYLHTGGRAI
jgi:hypothetical protein